MSADLWMIPVLTVGMTVAGALVFLSGHIYPDSTGQESPGQESSVRDGVNDGAEVRYLPFASASTLAPADKQAFGQMLTRIAANEGERETGKQEQATQAVVIDSVYVMLVADVPVARCVVQVAGNEVRIEEVLVDKRQRGKGYCPRLIASVANHQTSSLKRKITIASRPSNAAARACYRKVFEEERQVPGEALVKFERVRAQSAIAHLLVPMHSPAGAAA
jgi:ribosomal protein S18 acetylase RimI-like enzyme